MGRYLGKSIYVSKSTSWLIVMSLLVVAVLTLWYAVEPGYAQSAPEVSITSDGDVIEGADATFTVTASSAPASDLTVAVTVAEWPASGGIATSGETGAKNVTIRSGRTTATLTVGTDNDIVDEPRGIIMASLDTPAPNAGYTVSASSGYGMVVVSDNDDPTTTTEITISRGSSVQEGGTSRFLIIARPRLTSPVTVNIGLSEVGDFGASGPSTVRVKDTVSYDVTTVNDNWDESHGSITATILPGSDYSVGTPSSATNQVWDDDIPGQTGDPKVSISGGSDITEGGSTTFTITAAPVPTAPITVNVGVSDDGDFGATGPATVTMSGSTTSYTITTSDDTSDEEDGSATVTIKPGSGYDVGNPSTASVDVEDNDGPAISIDAYTTSITEGGTAVSKSTIAQSRSRILLLI